MVVDSHQLGDLSTTGFHSLESEPRADLKLSREPAARERGGDQEVLSLIPAWIGEVRPVGDVEHLEEEIDRPALLPV